ncbi:hypothetical protein J2X77_003275 [Sphingobacterium sp. 2149]|uniref:Uncharacterized protein n=1 Tax=Sphingobacterium zeae TaxID=1776859 RepID=A0ABU0U3D9_9SPHI|nr:hypothetical protein [Sphingobacterium zeae]MDR6736402.1 hypothetical protein [Sphingobacterium sp. 2149]
MTVADEIFSYIEHLKFCVVLTFILSNYNGNKVKGLYLIFNNQKRDKPFHAYETFYIIHNFIFKRVYDI